MTDGDPAAPVGGTCRARLARVRHQAAHVSTGSITYLVPRTDPHSRRGRRPPRGRERTASRTTAGGRGWCPRTARRGRTRTPPRAACAAGPSQASPRGAPRSSPAAAVPRTQTARRASGRRPRRRTTCRGTRAVHLERQRRPRSPAGFSVRAVAPELAHSTVGRRFLRACRNRVTSGHTTTGCPTASAGEVRVAVGVAVRRREVHVVLARPLTHPRRPRLTDEGRRLEEPVRRRGRRPQLRGLDVVEERGHQAGQRADRPGDNTVGCPLHGARASVVPRPARAGRVRSRRAPRRPWRRGRRAGHLRTPGSRAGEGARPSARHAPGPAPGARSGRPRRTGRHRQLPQPHPQVGLDDVGRQQRARPCRRTLRAGAAAVGPSSGTVICFGVPTPAVAPSGPRPTAPSHGAPPGSPPPEVVRPVDHPRFEHEPRAVVVVESVVQPGVFASSKRSSASAYSR